MGKIGQGILGGISGKVGNVIGASWKGIHYLRIKPTSVANPRTPGQVSQRNKFSAVLAFLKPNQSYVKLGFKFYQNRQSALNAAMAYNIRNAITGVAPDFSVDYPAVLLSRGGLLAAAGAGATVAGNVVTFNWDDNSTEGNARPDDEALLLVYNPTKLASVSMLEGAARNLGTAMLTVPESYSGDEVHFYVAFRAADGSAVSDSVYAGSASIA